MIYTHRRVFPAQAERQSLQSLREAIGNTAPIAYAGIAHTRWATHGAPTDHNAHPHLSFDGEIVLVHNGIIENYEHLKGRLTEKGIPFTSDTDTEVLCNWIAYTAAENPALSWPEILRKAFQHVEGTFGVAMLRRKAPQEVTLVRRFSPIVIGLLPDGYMAASDATPLVAHTREVLHLEDDDLAIPGCGFARTAYPYLHLARQRTRKVSTSTGTSEK